MKGTTENLKLNLEQKHTVMNEDKNKDLWRVITAVDGTKHDYMAKGENIRRRIHMHKIMHMHKNMQREEHRC